MSELNLSERRNVSFELRNVGFVLTLATRSARSFLMRASCACRRHFSWLVFPRQASPTPTHAVSLA